MSRQVDIQKIIATDYASKPEAALFLEVTERTLERWVREDDAPPVILIRKKLFFEKRALAEYKRRREQQKARR